MSRSVLVVDDEPLARARLCRLLEDIDGFDVVEEAQNGAEALQLADSVGADIVLMDLRMPGLDGLEAAAALAQHELPPAVIFALRLMNMRWRHLILMPSPIYSSRCGGRNLSRRWSDRCA